MIKKNKPGQGRKAIGQERGGLVPMLVNVFGDQAEILREQGNVQAFIRLAIDLALERGKVIAKKSQKDLTPGR
jgi:hypothetical protein